MVKKTECDCDQCSIISKALTGGIFFGVYTFLSVIIENYGFAGLWFNPRVLGIIASVIPGITVGWTGAFIGLIGAFITGFLGVALICWLYYKIDRYCSGKLCKACKV